MPRFGPQFQDRPVIAVGETHYHGEPVAAVAAETADAAEEAARLVRVDVRAAAGGRDHRRRARPRRAARPGPVAAARTTRSPATNVLREHRYGWGDVDAAAGDAEVVVEGTLRLPDGHPVRHRAARLHGRAGRRRHRGLELDPASVLAAAGRRRRARPAAREGARLRAGPGRGVRWQAARQVRAARRVPGPADRPAGPAGPVARGDVPGGPPRRLGGPRPDRLPARRHDRLPGHPRRLPHRRLRRHRRPDRRQGQLHVERPVRGAGGPRSSPGASCRTPCPSTAFRGFGNPQQIWAVESNLNEAAPRPRHRPGRAAPAQPRPAGRRVHPGRHAGRRRLGDEPASRGRDDRLGRAGARGPRPRDRGRPQVGPDDRAVARDRPAARRRQRGALLRHVRHGPGRAHDLRPDRRRGAGRAGRARSPSSWATPRSCPTTSRPRPAARR